MNKKHQLNLRRVFYLPDPVVILSVVFSR